MRTHAVRLVALSLSALLAAVASLRADSVYINPGNPYSVTVHDSSSVFNTMVGWNGSRADFGKSWGSYYVAGGPNWSGTQYFSATFQANPGSVFTSASIGFSQWSFSVPEGGYLHLYMNWSLPGSVYTGSNYTPNILPLGGTKWVVGDGSGQFEWRHAITQGGGGFEFMPIMDFGSQLLLNNVSNFTVSFAIGMAYGGNVFGDGTGAGLGFSFFSVMPVLTAGTLNSPVNPPGTAVPDTGATALLLGAGVLGLIGARRRLKMNLA